MKDSDKIVEVKITVRSASGEEFEIVLRDLDDDFELGFNKEAREVEVGGRIALELTGRASVNVCGRGAWAGGWVDL